MANLAQETGQFAGTSRVPLLLAAAFIIAFFALTHGLVFLGMGTGTGPTRSLLVAEITGYGAVAGLVVVACWTWHFSAGWRATPGRAWPAAVLLGLAAVAIGGRFLLKQPPAHWPTNTAAMWHTVTEAYVVGRLLVPFAEELLFRGLLWSIVAALVPQRRGSVSWATVVTALLFGVLHWPGLYGLPVAGGGAEVASALAAGLVFGALREHTGSFLPGLGLHILGNTLSF